MIIIVKYNGSNERKKNSIGKVAIFTIFCVKEVLSFVDVVTEKICGINKLYNMG